MRDPDQRGIGRPPAAGGIPDVGNPHRAGRYPIAAGATTGAVRRFVFRLPLTLERLGIRGVDWLVARLLGVEWIVLETVGRRTGRPHVIVLDVVGRDVAHERWYVQPAYGERSDWVRNVRRNPHVVARAGGLRFRARVRDATGPEGAEVVLRFVRAHPWYARVVVWFVGYLQGLDRPDGALRRDLERTIVLAVEAEPGSSPSPA